ncbi:hypothetical protein MHO82_24625 [Vibrio sp. Of7-15]|uniref:hypothetical protein n=1 Tax=Vibrio sp. Of7-15 TaxID=2724879 RepID=UPI001EF3629E|nr:hypothetical protein [Vibrio sp. Of7-15]MCG7500053.1 hypothetical protein [Vibrio sp. Of7-15]
MKFSSIREGQHLLAAVNVEQIGLLFDACKTDGKDLFLQKKGEVVAVIECNNAQEFKDFQQRIEAIGISPHPVEC